MKHISWLSILIPVIHLLASCQQKEKILLVSEQLSPQEKFGVEKLGKTLVQHGYEVSFSDHLSTGKERQIVIHKLTETFSSNFIKKTHLPDSLGKEGFFIHTSGKTTFAAGADPNGILYACLEISDLLKKEGKLPGKINLTDQPLMVMRGTCIGLQKTEYLPGRTVYEYPYTPENFPWFYDKELWIKYLDMLAENRFNALFLWNGHPFASLVRLKDYPYAVEVDEATFLKNEEIFAFLTEEAGKRGIFIIQMFYNIIVSKPFAEHHHLKTQERERPIIPVIADYTRKSIAAFIEKYPNVGLLITLGEAMNTIEDDIDWFTRTILPGVRDGLQALGRNDEPPVVLRGHDTDAKRVMEAALPVYHNLYTMQKYNGESLTTYEPRDTWETIPRGLADIGTLHIANVHILANLEPFRWSSPDFIQKCVVAMYNIQGAKGLHIYPQASYWDWPFSADKTDPRLLEMDRDRIWYKAWARYAWNFRRSRTDEINFWNRELGDFYGHRSAGKYIRDAYEQTGEIAPKLLRTFGISDGNRQTLLLGMFLSQLVNPLKYNVYSNFWTSSGPEKEVLLQYAEKEWKGQPHTGETPPMIIEDVVARSNRAAQAIENASGMIRTNRVEFSRLKNDIYCYRALAHCFSEKVKAAMFILRYQYSKDVADLEKALPSFEKSMENYAELATLTESSYLYANSMQTAQRRIPITGANGTNKTWKELLPYYRIELDNFKRNLEMLKLHSGTVNTAKDLKPFIPAQVRIMDKEFSPMPLKKGQQVYNDTQHQIEGIADELQNLTGLQMSNKKQREEGTLLRFENDRPVKVLVGYFNGNSYSILPAPTLETNAHANDRGQADIKIANALHIPGLYPVNVYTYSYPSGKNELKLGKGIVLILGFVNDDQEIISHDAGIGTEGSAALDWLFY